MSNFRGIAGYNSGDSAWENIHSIDNKLRVSSQDYLIGITEGEVPNHALWTKIGFTPSMTTSESDVWSYGATQAQISFPASAAQWEVDSTDADDRGDVIFGNAEGANQTILCDAGGNGTTLIDSSVNFTGVAVGDCVLLEPKGTTPEWGYITDITNAATGTLVIGNGFSSGGSCATARAYTIVDKSAYVGAQVVKIDYLDSSYAQKSCLVCLNGQTDVAIDGSDGAAATDKFRVNSFRVIATGTDNDPQGGISLRATGDTPVYSYITAGFTRARNSAYTVPAGKTLWVYQILFSFGHTTAGTTHYARMYTRANIEPTTNFNTGSIFYPFSEATCTNAAVVIPINGPTKLPAKTDIKISGIATATGTATCVLRGWLETA